MYEVNTWAVIVSAAAYMVIGAVWYSTKVFGKTWMHLSGLTKDDMGSMGSSMASGAVVAIISAYTLAKLFKYTGAATVPEAIQITFLVWIGLIMAPVFNDVIYGKKPRRLWLLNGFYQLASMLAATIILTSWK